ncbi:pilus assembly PilX N-terminal domain-containing protein [Candidatus Daviesbacteria bacterium]|nr:pilus assembly PilX N-terminal domain-containing protein [Candidatus Daviesbacteria bacterium]
MKDEKGLPVRQAGQIVLILVLVMTVALAIGISVVQRSLSDISTSTKVEQSSRAFSAAEAGIENKLSGGTGSVSFDNQATAIVTGTNDWLPTIKTDNTRQDPLEYPLLTKEEVAHVWLIANLNDTNNPPAQGYKQSTLDVYWGNSATDQAALELTLIYYGQDSGDPVNPNTNKYRSKKWYLDHNVTRSPDNKFEKVTACSGNALGANAYQCKKILNFSLTDTNARLMLLRARLLYNTTSQPFAVQAVNSCGRDCSVTPQARILESTGTSGQTQRKVRLFQIFKVVPPYFDYAIFSAGEISK